MCRLGQLEEENRWPKGIVADRALDIRAVDVLANKRPRPTAKRKMMTEVMAQHHISQRRACGCRNNATRVWRSARRIAKNRGNYVAWQKCIAVW